MRIIIIHNFYKKSGGEDVVFEEETNLLRENGHDVECLTFDNKSINSSWKTVLYFFKSIYNPSSAKILRKRIIDFKPNIIHVHNTFLVASPSIYWVAYRMGIPLVQTLHNYRTICPSSNLYFDGQIYTKSVNKIFPLAAIFKGVYRNSIAYSFLVATISAVHKIIGTYKKGISKFICLSKHSKNIFTKSSLKLDESQIDVKPNFLKDPGKESIEKEDFYIYVGRLTVEKGVKTLLKAFENIDKKLVIIGDGDLRNEVENASKNYKNIIYKGFQNREAIMKDIRKAQALIFPSEWYETFGLTIIEAFACKTPVIISDIGGHAQMIQEGMTGFHFKCGQHEDLKRAISVFEKTPNKNQFAENARKEYEEKYTAKKNYTYLIDIYKSLLN